MIIFNVKNEAAGRGSPGWSCRGGEIYCTSQNKINNMITYNNIKTWRRGAARLDGLAEAAKYITK